MAPPTTRTIRWTPPSWWRRSTACARAQADSAVAELVEAFLAEPEEMRELVRDGDLHLAPEHGRIVAEVLDERAAEERDHGRQLPDGIVAERRPVEQRIGIVLTRRRQLL